MHLAMNEWERMKATDSRECRNCHDFESMMPEFQKPRARQQHLNAMRSGQTCIDCHKGIAHSNARDRATEEYLEELEAPNPDFIREIPPEYLASLERIEAKEAAEAEAEKAAKSLRSKRPCRPRSPPPWTPPCAEERAKAAGESQAEAAPAGGNSDVARTSTGTRWPPPI